MSIRINLCQKYLHFCYENNGNTTLLLQNQPENTSEVREEW